MGIGGAAVYSLVLMVIRELFQLRSCASRVLRSIRLETLDGTAKYGANLYAMPQVLDRAAVRQSSPQAASNAFRND